MKSRRTKQRVSVFLDHAPVVCPTNPTVYSNVLFFSSNNVSRLIKVQFKGKNGIKNPWVSVDPSPPPVNDAPGIRRQVTRCDRFVCIGHDDKHIINRPVAHLNSL